jgi:hypothetical protein
MSISRPGFNLEEEPSYFDGIYTGTETRDPCIPHSIFNSMKVILFSGISENIARRNGGGWVDPAAAFYMDRYAEQLWLTLFAKAPEITLFDYRQLQNPLNPAMRASWQGTQTSFDYDEMMKPVPAGNGTAVIPTTIARAAGYTFETVDRFLDQIGNPVGIKSYRPYHATGEDFLQNYFGMIGIPMDIVPEFPSGDSLIILTESAAFDPLIVQKIKNRLTSGRNVMITSGLLKAMQGKGIEDIVELRYTDRKALVSDFVVGWGVRGISAKPILIPQIDYLTNDSWEDISASGGATGWPILHQAQYSKGYLYVLTIPDNFSDLYNYPPEVLNRVRTIVSQDLDARIEGPSQVSLFAYDNSTFIIESFLPEPVTVRMVVNRKATELVDLISGDNPVCASGTSPHMWGRESHPVISAEITLKPHSYRVIKIK